jgi:hypothetical protein
MSFLSSWACGHGAASTPISLRFLLLHVSVDSQHLTGVSLELIGQIFIHGFQFDVLRTLSRGL